MPTPEGAHVSQTIYEAGGGVQATAVGNGETQRRSYPQSHGRQQGCAGWEYVVEMDLAGNARRVAEEAAELLTAEPCPVDITTDLIIDSSQLALQIHESCGHAVELDRALGDEAAFAGTSFLTPDLLHDFRYGSEQVNIVADSVSATGLGTFGWDDEGLPAQSTDIIRNGQFVGYLMSRESATRLGLASNGCMRASSWNRIPLIRMTNVSLQPGEWTPDDLIADTDDGIYLETNRSWSIDDRRYNFQFGTEVGREIKNGKLGRLLRNPTYTGITPEFWRNCDAVCGPEHWTALGNAPVRQGTAGPDCPHQPRRQPGPFPQRPRRRDAVMLGPEYIRPLLRDALRHCPAGSDGDIYLTATEQALTRFANNRIHQNVAHQDAAAHVRVVAGKRQGRAVTNNLSADGLADAVRQAAEYARLMPEDPDFPGLPEPLPAQSVAAYDDATAACDAGQRAATVGMVCRKAAALSLDAAGFCRTGVTELAVASTRGADAYHAGTFAGLLITARSDDSAGWSKGGGWRMGEVNAESLADEAIGKAVRGRNPQALEPGEYPGSVGTLRR